MVIHKENMAAPRQIPRLLRTAGEPYAPISVSGAWLPRCCRRQIQPQWRAFSATREVRQTPRVAVLYQELEPPLINGTRKPKKPGGKHRGSACVK